MNRSKTTKQQPVRPAQLASQGRRLRVESLERRELLSGEPTLIDVNQQPGPNGIAPRNFVDVGGTLYFTASDSATGVELWKSDGTAAGTVLV